MDVCVIKRGKIKKEKRQRKKGTKTEEKKKGNK
jgi:hypothetical protein